MLNIFSILTYGLDEIRVGSKVKLKRWSNEDAIPTGDLHVKWLLVYKYKIV